MMIGRRRGVSEGHSAERRVELKSSRTAEWWTAGWIVDGIENRRRSRGEGEEGGEKVDGMKSRSVCGELGLGAQEKKKKKKKNTRERCWELKGRGCSTVNCKRGHHHHHLFGIRNSSLAGGG